MLKWLFWSSILDDTLLDLWLYTVGFILLVSGNPICDVQMFDLTGATAVNNNLQTQLTDDTVLKK